MGGTRCSTAGCTGATPRRGTSARSRRRRSPSTRWFFGTPTSTTAGCSRGGCAKDTGGRASPRGRPPSCCRLRFAPPRNPRRLDGDPPHCGRRDHHRRQRHGQRRPHPSPPVPQLPAARKPDHDRGLPGPGHSGPGPGRRRPHPAPVRRGGPGQCLHPYSRRLLGPRRPGGPGRVGVRHRRQTRHPPGARRAGPSGSAS